MAQVPAVVVERARCQAQQKLSLLLIEHPGEIPVGRHVRHERGGLDFPGRGLERGPSTGEVSLAEERHGLALDQYEVGGREGEATVDSLPRLGIASQPEKRFAETPLNVRRIGDRGAPPV